MNDVLFTRTLTLCMSVLSLYTCLRPITGIFLFCSCSLAVSAQLKVADSIRQDAKQVLEPLKSPYTKAGEVFSGLLKKPAFQLPPAPDLRLKKEAWFKHKNLAVELQGQSASAYFNPGTYYVQNDLRVAEQVSIQNIPVTMHLQLRSFAEETFRYQTIFNVRYEHETYIRGLRDKLSKQLKPEDFFPDEKEVTEARDKLEKTIHTESANIQQQYGQLLSKYSAKGTSIQALLQQDPVKIREQLLQTEVVQEVTRKQQELQVMQSRLQQGAAVDTALMRKMQLDIKEYHQLTDLYQKAIQAKAKIQKTADSKLIRDAKALKQVKLDKMLQDPAKVKELAAKYLPLSSLEKTLLSLNKLNIGQGATTLSPLTLSNFNGSGISTEFSNKNKYLFLIFSKERSNSLLDMPFMGGNVQQQATGNYQVMGFRTGYGASMDKNFAHLSVMSFRQKQPKNAVSMPGSAMVITLSNRMNIDEETSITMEVSRSSAAVDNESSVGDTTQRDNATLHKLLAANKHNQSLAIDFTYDGHYRAIGLDAYLQVSWLSKDYFNPGNPYAISGSRQIDMSLRKSFLERKLQFASRFNYRQYGFSVLNNSNWQNYFFYLDAKWALEKGQFISLKYSPSKGVRMENSRTMPTSASSKITGAGSVNRQFGHIFYQGIYNLGSTSNRYNFYTQGTNLLTRSVNLMAANNLHILERNFSLNLQYDHVYERTSELLMNSTFNADISCAQPLGKKLMISSGITYFSVKGWYRQLGVRQGLSWSLNDKLQADLFVDVRGNLGKPQQNFGYNDLFRGDWSLKYNF